MTDTAQRTDRATEALLRAIPDLTPGQARQVADEHNVNDLPPDVRADAWRVLTAYGQAGGSVTRDDIVDAVATLTRGNLCYDDRDRATASVSRTSEHNGVTTVQAVGVNWTRAKVWSYPTGQQVRGETITTGLDHSESDPLTIADRLVALAEGAWADSLVEPTT